MKTSQRLLEAAVYQSIFKDETSPDTTPGLSAYEVKLKFTPAMSDVPQIASFPVRADSPEQAKSMAMQVATEMGHTNLSVVDVVLIPTPPKPEDKPAINIQPGTLAGLVLPSAVNSDLDTSQVLLPGR